MVTAPQFRKISVRLLGDRKWRSWSDPARLLWVTLLLWHRINGFGVASVSLDDISKALNWSKRKASRNLNILVTANVIEVDHRNRLIWAKNYLKHNPPQNPNMVRSWGHAFDLLPECELTEKVRRKIITYSNSLPNDWQKQLPQHLRNSKSKRENKEIDRELLPPEEPPAAGPKGPSPASSQEEEHEPRCACPECKAAANTALSVMERIGNIGAIASQMKEPTKDEEETRKKLKIQAETQAAIDPPIKPVINTGIIGLGGK